MNDDLLQSDFFQKKASYIFDTSSFILLKQFYPIDIFKQLHEKITPILESGKIVVLDLVFDELKDKEPNLYKFLRSTIPADRQIGFENYIETTQEIIQKYYDGKGKSHKIKADPHIIACAKIEKINLVTEELNSDITKIPYVCTQEKVSWINFVDFLRKEGIMLG